MIARLLLISIFLLLTVYISAQCDDLIVFLENDNSSLTCVNPTFDLSEFEYLIMALHCCARWASDDLLFRFLSCHSH